MALHSTAQPSSAQVSIVISLTSVLADGVTDLCQTRVWSAIHHTNLPDAVCNTLRDHSVTNLTDGLASYDSW